MESNFKTEEQFLREAEKKTRQRQEAEDLLEVLALPAGRRFIARQLRQGGMGMYLASNDATVGAALRLFEEIKTADASAASDIIKMVFELGENNG